MSPGTSERMSEPVLQQGQRGAGGKGRQGLCKAVFLAPAQGNGLGFVLLRKQLKLASN